MKAAHTISPKYLTLSEAARYCSLSEKTLRRKMDAGNLAYYRPCRSVLISVADLDAMMETSRVETINFDDLLVR